MKIQTTVITCLSLLLGGGVLCADTDAFSSRDNAQQALLQEGIPPTEYERHMFNAAATGDTRILRLLIAAGANIDLPMSGEGRASKMFNSYVGDTSGDPDAKFMSSMFSVKGMTPLMLASITGQKDVVRLLLAEGADPNRRSENGSSALLCTTFGILWRDTKPDSYVASSGSLAQYAQIAELLIESGADVNSRALDGQSALHYAAWYGEPELAAVFLKHGANPNLQDLQGMTPVACASVSSYGRLLELMLPAMGASGEAIAPFVQVLSNIKGSTSDVLAMLLDAGGDPNKRNQTGLAPLHFAAVTGNEKAISMLTAAGADVNARDEAGMTPLHYAADVGDRGAINALMKAGADITLKDNDGETAADLLND